MRILTKARKWLLAVLHKFSMCVVEDSLSSIVIPSSLTSLLDFTLLFSIINVILLLSIFEARNVIWDLTGFATMLLILNHLRIKCWSLDQLPLQNLVSMNIFLYYWPRCKLSFLQWKTSIHLWIYGKHKNKDGCVFSTLF